MDVSRIEKLFQIYVFNGCIGSSDGTHVGLLCFPSWAFNNHKEQKLAVPSRNCNATVRHWRKIIGTTLGHLGTWNDKPFVIFDELIKNIQNGELMEDKEYESFELDKDDYVVTIKYLGAWFIADNDYLE